MSAILVEVDSPPNPSDDNGSSAEDIRFSSKETGESLVTAATVERLIEQLTPDKVPSTLLTVIFINSL